MSFDYGTKEEVSTGSSMNEKLIPEGDYAARLTMIAHMGVTPKEKFDKSGVDFMPQAVARFELVDTDEAKDIFEDDGETHQSILKDFSLKSSDGKSDMDKIIAFGKAKAEGFDDLIDSVYTIKVKHSKCGKYNNLVGFSKGGLSSYPSKFWKSENKAQTMLGHVKFEDLTKEAIESMHSWNHVADVLVKGRDYAGSQAEKVIEEIRAEEGRENFGTKIKKKKDDKSNSEPSAADKKSTLSDTDEVKPEY
jgi:hypothetical protein